MSRLADLKIRNKITVALLPLAAMIVLATLYASVEMERIDSWYSDLIGKDVVGLQKLSLARTINNRFGQLIYQEIAEPNAAQRRALDDELNRSVSEFHSSIAEAGA